MRKIIIFFFVVTIFFKMSLQSWQSKQKYNACQNTFKKTAFFVAYSSLWYEFVLKLTRKQHSENIEVKTLVENFVEDECPF